MARALYAIIGDPIAQARSPDVFNALFMQRRIDAEMIALEVGASEFVQVLDGLIGVRNFRGAVITIPHKTTAAAIAKESSGRVLIAGAANALRPVSTGWSADLFDGVGFVAGLTSRGHDVAGSTAAVVGAGGAGLAIAAALLDAGAGLVAIDDKDAQRAELAVARLGATYPGRIVRRSPGSQDDLVVNATPVGMQPSDPLPILLDDVRPEAVVADAIMKPPVTLLLEEARRRGHPILEGRHMLEGQVEAIWKFLDMDGQTRPIGRETR